MQEAELRHSYQWSHSHHSPGGTASVGMLPPQPHVGGIEATPLKHDAFCGELPSGQGMRVRESLRHLPKTRQGKLLKTHPCPLCGHLSASPPPAPKGWVASSGAAGWFGVHVVEEGVGGSGVARHQLTLRQGTLRYPGDTHTPGTPGTPGDSAPRGHPTSPVPQVPPARRHPATPSTPETPAAPAPAVRALPGGPRAWGRRAAPARAQCGGPGATAAPPAPEPEQGQEKEAGKEEGPSGNVVVPRVRGGGGTTSPIVQQAGGRGGAAGGAAAAVWLPRGQSAGGTP